MSKLSPVLRHFGLVEYGAAFALMKQFSDARAADTPDEIWFLQHAPVYTLGLSGRTEHLLDARGIPVVRTDRGGQVTYHGPGQLVAYTLLDLRRIGLGIRPLVTRLEQSVIDLLAEFGIEGTRRAGAPGVYVNGAKIAALGVRVRRGRCYHGLALNVAMDLAPYRGINPCGYAGLAVTQLADLGVAADCEAIALRLAPHLQRNLYADGVHAVIPEAAPHEQCGVNSAAIRSPASRTSDFDVIPGGRRACPGSRKPGPTRNPATLRRRTDLQLIS